MNLRRGFRFDVRRGMAGFGFAVLVLWEIYVISGCVVALVNGHPEPEFIWKYLLLGGIVTPAVVWVCWRALLWVTRGFFREVSNP